MSPSVGLASCKHGIPFNKSCEECDPAGFGELWSRMQATMAQEQWVSLEKALEAVILSGYGVVSIDVEKGVVKRLHLSSSLTVTPPDNR